MRKSRNRASRIYFREDLSARLVGGARARPFSSKDSRAYDASRGFSKRGPESARRILIMRAKLWAGSRRWNICVFAGRGLWLNYHLLFPLRVVDLRRPLPAPERTILSRSFRPVETAGEILSPRFLMMNCRLRPSDFWREPSSLPLPFWRVNSSLRSTSVRLNDEFRIFA